MRFHILAAILAGFLLFGCTQPSSQPENDTSNSIVTTPEVSVQVPQNTSQVENQSIDIESARNETNQSSIASEEPRTNYAVVSEIIDGDTVQLQTGEKVRLIGINTPEAGQPYYEEAKNRLSQLVEGGNVTLESDVEDKDQYGRLLRFLFIGDENINVVLVREGLATVYIVSPNSKYEGDLGEAENEAKNLKLGVWTPTEPSEDENICDDTCIAVYQLNWNAEGNDCDNLNDEYVVIRNSCSHPCDLTRWTVKDESSRTPYSFPSFILQSSSSVSLYTGCGTDTATQLYWCSRGYSCNAIWNNDGDTLYMRDSLGGLVLSYSYSGYS